MPRQKVIGIIGGRRASKKLLKEAEEAGRLVAKSGYALLTGGLGGVMEAASRGAHEAGGITIGILPHDTASSANDYIMIAIPTGLGIGRNVIVARASDGLIAVAGEYGTLTEIAFALQMGKPVVGIGSWDIDGVIQAKNAEEAVGIVLRELRK